MLMPLNNKVLVKVLEKKRDPNALILVNTPDVIKTCEVLALPHGETEIHLGDKVLIAFDRMAEVSDGSVVDRKDILGILD